MNTNVTSSYWDFDIGEVKFFSPTFVPSTVLADYFTIKISQNQITKLKNLASDYQELLIKYKSYTNLTDEQITHVVDGLSKRIQIFEDILKSKNLIN